MQGRQLYLCTTCGSWAVDRAIKLRQQCRGAPLQGSAEWTALRSIARGQTPGTFRRVLDPARAVANAQAVSQMTSSIPSSAKYASVPLIPSLEAVRTRIRSKQSAARDNSFFFNVSAAFICTAAFMPGHAESFLCVQSQIVPNSIPYKRNVFSCASGLASVKPPLH